MNDAYPSSESKIQNTFGIATVVILMHVICFELYKQVYFHSVFVGPGNSFFLYLSLEPRRKSYSRLFRLSAAYNYNEAKETKRATTISLAVTLTCDRNWSFPLCQIYFGYCILSLRRQLHSCCVLESSAPSFVLCLERTIA